MTTDRYQQDKQPDDPMEGRKPWIRVDKAQIVEDPSTSGGYRVQIYGHNLKMAISPPRITVAGVPLENLSFESGGKTITGTLSRKPESDEVIVDYGFARGETKAAQQE
jgi:hypothetical protein